MLLSQFPLAEQPARTFQNFLWKDMPGALLPDNRSTQEAGDWYSAEELDVFRLSSKSHWDVSIDIGGEIVHVLAAHPTPPVFDGAEDRNGKRNHDEIRFWADYVDPAKSQYIIDDEGTRGGLAVDEKFVILGDYNADPWDGDSTSAAARQLLDSPFINTSIVPDSPGGPEAASRQARVNDAHTGNPAFDTAHFGDVGSTPGNLRVDYVLPSTNVGTLYAGVFWPTSGDPLFELVGDFNPNLPGPRFPSSDHRLVYVDVLVPEPPARALFWIGTITLLALGLWAVSLRCKRTCTTPELSANSFHLSPQRR